MKRIAIVDGIRTPFCRAGTLLKDFTAIDLGRIATRGLMEKLDLDPHLIDEVIFGNVAQPPEAANISRVISLLSAIPQDIPAYTVQRNCASSLEALTSGYEKIQAEYAQILLVGGTESMTNIPFLLSKELTDILTELNMAKNIFAKLKALSKFRLGFLKPKVGLLMGLTDMVCGLNMGQTAEILAKEFGISRRRQDGFALISHKRAIAAVEKLREEITPIFTGKDFKKVIQDDFGPRKDTSLEALAKLSPFFERSVGTVTVGNSCQITDGACTLLIMPEDRARELGYEPLGYIRSYAYAGLGPHRMGLGPSFAIPKALKKAVLSLKDIQLVEINEAFAAQVLAVLESLHNEISPDILNVNGGAIALGHPVGTTGARLVLTILKEMKRRNLNLGLVSLCVGGGQGACVILER